MQTPIQHLIPEIVQNQLIVLEAELICIEAVSYADEVRFGWQHDGSCLSCAQHFNKTVPNQFYCDPCFESLSRPVDTFDDLPF